MTEVNTALPPASEVQPTITNTPVPNAEHQDAHGSPAASTDKKKAPTQAVVAPHARTTKTESAPIEGPGLSVRKTEMTVAGRGTALGKDGSYSERSHSEMLNVPERILANGHAFAELHVANISRLKNTPVEIIDAAGNKIKTNAYDLMKQEDAKSGDPRTEDEEILMLFSEIDSATGLPKAIDYEKFRKIVKDSPKVLFGLMIAQENWRQDIDTALGRRPKMSKGGKKVDYLSTGLTGLDRASKDHNIRMREMVGIDPKKRSVSPLLQQRMDESRRAVFERADFLTSLGVSGKQLDSSSEDFIYRSFKKQSSVRRTPRGAFEYEVDSSLAGDDFRRIMDRLIFEDKQQRLERQRLNPKDKYTPITQEETRAIYRRARAELFSKYVGETLAKLSKEDNPLARLDKQIEFYSGADGAKKARTESFVAEKGRLTSDRTALEGDKAKITAYEVKLAEGPKKRQELDDLIKLYTDNNINFRQQATILTPREIITELQKALSDPTFTGKIMVPPESGGDLIEVGNIQQLSTDLRNRKGQAQAQFTPRQTFANGVQEDQETFTTRKTAFDTSIKDQFKDEEADIALQRNLVQAAIQRITKLQNDILAAETAAVSSSETSAAFELIKQSKDALAKVQAITPPGTDFNHTMELINQEFATSNGTRGWDASDNDANRHLLRLAYVRTNTLNALAADQRLNRFGNSVAVLTQNGITTDELRTLSIAELEAKAARLNLTLPLNPAAPTAAPVPLTPNQINQAVRAAKIWAEEEVKYTKMALESEITQIQTGEQVQDRKIKNENVDTEHAQLELVKKLYTDSAGIKERAAISVSNDKKRQILLNSATLPNTPGAAENMGYTKAEVDSGLPANVLEIINIISNYQDQTDMNRADAFNAFIKSLGPQPYEKLTDLLQRSFSDLPELPIAYNDPIIKFSYMLNKGIANSTVTPGTISRNMDKFIDELLTWSRSI